VAECGANVTFACFGLVRRLASVSGSARIGEDRRVDPKAAVFLCLIASVAAVDAAAAATPPRRRGAQEPESTRPMLGSV